MEVTMDELLSTATEDMAWRPKIARIEGGLLYTTDKATLLATDGDPCGDTQGLLGHSLFRTPGGRYFSVFWVGTLAPNLHVFSDIIGAFNEYYSYDTRLVPVKEAFPGLQVDEA